MPRRIEWAVGVSLALVLATNIAFADDAARAAAKKHNAEAEKLFNLGRFREAAAAYERAYLAKPVPELLYNCGQCFKRLGAVADLERALFYFESYANNATNPTLRLDAQEQIVKLRAELRSRRVALDRAPPVYKRWWFWTLVGVAVTGAAVGTAFALRPEDQQPVPGSVGDPSPLQLP
jgi:tetratricopeptide (TPR) repeat protein